MPIAPHAAETCQCNRLPTTAAVNRANESEWRSTKLRGLKRQTEAHLGICQQMRRGVHSQCGVDARLGGSTI